MSAYLACTLAAAALLGLAACGGREPHLPEPTKPPKSVRSPQEPTPSPRAKPKVRNQTAPLLGRCQVPALTGRCTDRATGLGLAEAVVIAQGPDGAVLAQTVTGADGRYILEGLPLGTALQVCSRPVQGAAAYRVQKSEYIQLSAAAPRAVLDLAFTVGAE